jgi:hypothetical protein
VAIPADEEDLAIDDLTFFVSSSDSYQDCWEPFFCLLAKHWPGCSLPIVLNTEERSFSHPDLQIHCTMTGRQKSFGETFQRGLDHVRTGNLLLIMIDYFLMSAVDTARLLTAWQAFAEYHLDGLYLVQMTTIRETTLLAPGISLVTAPGQDRFSFQAGIWKKDSLRKYVLRHETPWLAEQFGSMRYKYTSDRLAYVHRLLEPFDYPHTGVLHKGGWVREAVPALEELGVKLDWSERGFYSPRRPTLFERLMKRRQTAIEEAKSRLHLQAMKRQWLRSAGSTIASDGKEGT